MCDGPASLPVAAVATTTNASTALDSGDHPPEGFDDVLLRLTEQLETRNEKEGSAWATARLGLRPRPGMPRQRGSPTGLDQEVRNRELL